MKKALALLVTIISLSFLTITASASPQTAQTCYPFELGQVCLNDTGTPTQQTPTVTPSPITDYVIGSDNIYVNSHSPDQFVWDLLIFVNTATLDGTTTHPVNTWHVVDLSSVAPPDAKAVMLGGLLIITHGSSAETCNLTVRFRALGETVDYPYKFQAVESIIGGGVRSPAFTVVRLINGKFEMKWTAENTSTSPATTWSSSRQYPAYCSYGVNLSPEGFIR